MVKIGIIGGSGLDNPNILYNANDLDVNTPFGKPTSPLKTGTINGTEVVLIARHGREHTIPPTQVNFRANIHALKEASCTHILATTACGSLKQEIGRGDFVILDQFIDFTKHRYNTFHQEFQPGKIAHTPMANPFNKELRTALTQTCQELNLRYHPKGTVITIEGPRFSTKAESHMFRAWGADVINMSIAPEASLANEIGIPYAAIAMSTDYDCWKDDEEPVSWEAVLEIFNQNVEKVTQLLTNSLPKITHQEPIKQVDNRKEILKSKIKTYQNWPKEGIMFRDINSLLNDKEGLSLMTDLLVERYKEMDIDVVAGIESRGFITGSLLAHKLRKSFVLIRKPGKLPGETISQEYTLEYGTDKVEIQKNLLNQEIKFC
jgi:5'-methylthioadenosine phosphorylase